MPSTTSSRARRKRLYFVLYYAAAGSVLDVCLEVCRARGDRVATAAAAHTH